MKYDFDGKYKLGKGYKGQFTFSVVYSQFCQKHREKERKGVKQ